MFCDFWSGPIDLPIANCRQNLILWPSVELSYIQSWIQYGIIGQKSRYMKKLTIGSVGHQFCSIIMWLWQHIIWFESSIFTHFPCLPPPKRHWQVRSLHSNLCTLSLLFIWFVQFIQFFPYPPLPRGSILCILSLPLNVHLFDCFIARLLHGSQCFVVYLPLTYIEDGSSSRCDLSCSVVCWLSSSQSELLAVLVAAKFKHLVKIIRKRLLV